MTHYSQSKPSKDLLHAVQQVLNAVDDDQDLTDAMIATFGPILASKERRIDRLRKLAMDRVLRRRNRVLRRRKPSTQRRRWHVKVYC